MVTFGDCSGIASGNRAAAAVRWAFTLAARAPIPAGTRRLALLAVAEETVLAPPFGRPGKHRGDAGDRLLRPDDLDNATGGVLLLRRKNREHGDAVDLDFGLDPDDVTDLGTLWEQRHRHGSFGLACAGGAPGEGLVVASTGELYIHPVRHDRPKLQPSRHQVVMRDGVGRRLECRQLGGMEPYRGCQPLDEVSP